MEAFTMKRLKKYNTLFQIAPELVKQWHPTANENINPRNLEVVYPHEVWWLCNQGHEWQDTIKNRMRNIDCPICKKEETNKEIDNNLSISLFEKQRRKHKRFKTNAIIVLQIPKSGHWTYARVKNFSRKGLCVETDLVIRPGSEIKLKFDKNHVMSRQDNLPFSFNKNTFKTYNSTVKWFRIFEDELIDSNVNIGLEFK
jgi:hypothetical protein